MITNERRQDMLIGAIEGGSNYWYYIDEANSEKALSYGRIDDAFVEAMWKAILAGETIVINDVEDFREKLGEINMESIEKGEKLMAREQPYHYGDIWAESDDAITADVWFQYCVLGELVYG